jgi:minor extracellular protease Epr
MNSLKTVLLLLVALSLLCLPVVQAMPDPATQRVIAHTTSPFEKGNFQKLGCTILHELNDATAIECPEGVFIPNAEPDEILHILDIDADIQIHADDVWSLSSPITGDGVVVAVLDTGVDYTHPELGPYVTDALPVDVNGGIGGGKSFVSGSTSFLDDNGHGTHVSGIITADGEVTLARGVAPDATVWMAKVCNSGGSCYTSDMAAAIQYVVEHDVARIMSISIGGGGTTASACDSDYLASKINWAYEQGVVSAIAAGNEGRPRVSSPACASKAIAVAAVDKSDTRASWSNYGKALIDHGVAAPGVSIYSTVPGNKYESWSGTSMATPHVSALMALMLQKDPSLTKENIRSRIFQSADCLDGWYGTCPNTYIGFGRVDAYQTVNFGSTTPTQPYLMVTANPTSILAGMISEITAMVSDSAPSVTISFEPSASLSMSSCDTNAGGSCSVTFIPSAAGTFTFTASADGYTSDTIQVTVTSGSTPPTCTKVPRYCNCDGICGKNEARECADCLG